MCIFRGSFTYRDCESDVAKTRFIEFLQNYSYCDVTIAKMALIPIFAIADTTSRSRSQSESLYVNEPLSIGGSRGGVPGTRPPLRVQILSFRHIKFLKRNRLGSPRLPYEVNAPLREILDPPLLIVARKCIHMYVWYFKCVIHKIFFHTTDITTVIPRCNEFMCNNGECISLRQKCDGKWDCYDGSDEVYCRK